MRNIYMSNVTMVNYADATGELKLLYDEMLSTLNIEQLPNWALFLGGELSVLCGIWNMFRQVALKGSLDPLLQELIIFSVSRSQGSPYCSEFHASQILRLVPALNYPQLVEIIEGNSSGIIPERYQVAISIITQYSQSHCVLKKHELLELQEAGYDESSILELFGLCSLALAFNSLTMATNTPIEPSNRVANFYLQ